MSDAGRREHRTIPFDPAARDLGIVVGFDGSPNSELALDHAAATAARRGARLTVLTAYRVPLPLYLDYVPLPTPTEEDAAAENARRLLEAAGRRLAGHVGDVRYETVQGDSTGALAEASVAAQMLVIGARGRGGFLGLVMGSVSTTLPSHAKCPTVVVPAEVAPSDGPVVAGVDGSPHGRRAALHAAQEARERGTSLVLVTALQLPDSGEYYWFPLRPREASELVERRQAELEADLEQEIARVAEHAPGIEITGEVRVGEAAAVLHEVEPAAQLVVVGSHGRGLVASTLLGSVSRGTLHGARRPVMVVPPLQDERVEG